MTKKIRINQTSDGKISLGGVLSEEQKKALGGITPSADEILSNMEALNEELTESYGEEMGASKPKSKKLPDTSAKVKQKAKKRLSNKRRKSVQAVAEEEQTMDFDQEINALEQQLDEQSEPKIPEPEPGLDMRSQIIDLLKNTEGAPDEATIAQYKAKYGNNGVHVMALGEGDVYIFTHLKRGQWKKIQEMMAKIQETGNSDVEDALKEKVIQHCMIWPRLPVEFYYNSRAGVVDSLYQVILLNSYFLSPQQAMLLTTQL
ncbi:MAG: hypothetical protein CMF69_00240 [Magnetovibrio sp.]|nr:hypothetical protein [Magnetovibrio sp.]|tara:strand:- start:1039 stop:1818 length:780 start_codon:yes stop_codon:yes gene_type:complete